VTCNKACVCVLLAVGLKGNHVDIGRGVYSGGTVMTVTGQRLDVVARPLLAVYVGDDVFTSVS